ncbi:hypothetical protein OOG41_27000 [Bacillus sp. AS_5]|uniref:hypothetical protein n=1 Tax=unclassified Bacillus (in: firmicutes) TaxID=185979 RepID=UPI00224A588B|nr:hypothetical protein [Bacillus sp. AS_3]MCW4656992.1 hypothetical protein [Bacillus sp. AS_3]MCX2704732.1 hypothetical protein [Bacillus sp. AS_5]
MTNTFKIGQKVSGGLALLAMETHKIKNIDHGGFVFWYENGKLMGYAPDVRTSERERSIAYFHKNTFEVIGLIESPFKTGDFVRVDSHQVDVLLTMGEVVEVVGYDETKHFPIRVKKEDGREAVIIEKFARKLSESEVAEIKAARHRKAINELEVGAFVRITKGSQFGDDFETGDIVVVVYQETKESNCPIKVAPLHNPKKALAEWARCQEVEVVTEEEAINAKMSENGFTFSIHAFDFEIMTPKEIEEYEASLIKTEVGSYLVVTNSHGNPKFKVGEVVIVTGIPSASGIHVKSVDGKESGYKFLENVRNATAKEIRDAQTVKYNEGDYVVSVGGCNYPIGEVLEITKVNGNDHYDVMNLEGKTGGKQSYNIRKATEEEVKKAKKEAAAKKERKIFEDLGRKYGELKECDVVRVIDNCLGRLKEGDIGVVRHQDRFNFADDDRYSATVTVNGRDKVANNALVKLVVSVEHRLDK